MNDTQTAHNIATINKKKEFQGNYFQWIVSELKGVPANLWVIWFFGFGFQLDNYLKNQITTLSTVTLITTLIGLLCTCAMSAGRAINGLLGGLSVIGFIYVNWSAGHYASVFDQLIFFVLIDAPLLITWRTWGVNFNEKLRTLHTRGWFLTVIALIIEWVIFYRVYIFFKDTNPLWDSLVLSIGATASLFCTLHFSNTYSLWLAEDIVQVILWFTANSAGYTQASFAMLVSQLMYLATAIYGKWFSRWDPKRSQNI